MPSGGTAGFLPILNNCMRSKLLIVLNPHIPSPNILVPLHVRSCSFRSMLKPVSLQMLQMGGDLNEVPFSL